MKAFLCKEYGPPESLVLEEVPDPQAGPGQVVVDIKSCALNFPDALMIENKYQFKPELPFAPGGEIAGVVSAVGAGVSDLSVGDRVAAGIGNGGFAEKIAIKADQALKIPDGLDNNTASAFMTTYGTTQYALNDRGDLKPGETLLVLGASGGVGMAAIELGKVMGARVIAAASTAEKLAICKEAGADELINYNTEDLKNRTKELTGGKGADVVYDAVGGDYAEAALRATNWGGRFLVIGFVAGIPSIPLNLTLLKSCDVRGVFYGALKARDPKRGDEIMQEIVDLLTAGKIKPYISATYSLDNAAQALRDMVDRKVTGKVVVTI
ncbi:MAG: NADPH:quinone oxidoreductase family protein [Pseudomonadota bacterium]